MEKIIINPHNCSREEYVDLITYLQDECWDYKEVKENNKSNTLLEIEDYNGNTKYLINLEIENNKVKSVLVDEDILSLADEESNDKLQHIRLQEVKK